jgi:hypothetical protein
MNCAALYILTPGRRSQQDRHRTMVSKSVDFRCVSLIDEFLTFWRVGERNISIIATTIVVCVVGSATVPFAFSKPVGRDAEPVVWPKFARQVL